MVLFKDIQVGKFYGSNSKNKAWEVIYKDDEVLFYKYHNGGSIVYSFRTKSSLERGELKSWYEYKEPVIHKRDIVWWKGRSGRLHVCVYEHGFKLNPVYSEELKRETVSYEEE